MGKHLLIWLGVFFITSCSQNNETNEDSEQGVKYAAFKNGQPLVWESLELAQQRERTGGAIEVSRYHDIEQTPEQKIAADELYNKTLQNVIDKGWFDSEKVLDDGYKIYGGKGTHATNLKYMIDGEVLNPEKPEIIVIVQTEEGPMVSGVMFWMDDLEAHGPQIGGHETVWHFHQYMDENDGCVQFSPIYFIYNDFIPTLRKLRWCNGNIALPRTPEMLHIWFMEEHLGGRYTSSMNVTHKHVLDSPLIRSKGKIQNQGEADDLNQNKTIDPNQDKTTD